MSKLTCFSFVSFHLTGSSTSVINLVENNLFTIQEITFLLYVQLPFNFTKEKYRDAVDRGIKKDENRMWSWLSCFYYSPSSCPLAQCVNSFRWKKKTVATNTKGKENKKNLFLHSCNDNISFAIWSKAQFKHDENL